MFDDLEIEVADGGMTLEYIFEEITGAPSLICKPAIEANTAYNNAHLKEIEKRLARRTKVSLNATTMKLSRLDNARMYAKYCIVGYGTPPRSGGQEVDFKREIVQAFLETLIRKSPEAFDAFSAWIKESKNFIPEADTEEGEEEVDVGNSTASTSAGNSGASVTATA